MSDSDSDVWLNGHNQKTHVIVYISCSVSMTKYYVLRRKIRSRNRNVSKMLFALIHHVGPQG